MSWYLPVFTTIISFVVDAFKLTSVANNHLVELEKLPQKVRARSPFGHGAINRLRPSFCFFNASHGFKQFCLLVEFNNPRTQHWDCLKSWGRVSCCACEGML